jgi:hypothetical protein
MVPGGAKVAVVTRNLVQSSDTAQNRVAGIGRTDVTIIAVHGPMRALIRQNVAGVFRARVSVVARGRLRPATRRRDATVQSTLVTIVAIEVCPRLAADAGVAGFHAVAEISIVAKQGCSWEALALFALILHGAYVPVAACGRIVIVNTAHFCLADVIGARVAVVAIHSSPGGAGARKTLVAQGTEITIFAGSSVPRRPERAGPISGVAQGYKAHSVVAFRLGTDHGRAGHHGAFVRELIQVAQESPVAGIFVVKSSTIGIFLAIAGDWRTFAFPDQALVRHGAGVAIIAGPGDIRKVTSSLGRAKILGTWIAVVTLNRISQADPCLAVVRHGARITIQAFRGRKQFVYASPCSGARVLRAVIYVITCILVGQPVAIVVQTVTLLGRGKSRITLTQANVGANPLTGTGAKFRGSLTRRGETQCDRLLGAGTDPRSRHALGALDSFDRGGRDTGETPGTIIASPAQPAAERAFLAILETDVLRTTRGLAAFGRRTWFAEIGVVGNADRDQVRATPDGHTTPAGRALLLAKLGTDPFSEVLNAPAGETLLVGIALVEKAPFTGGAGRADHVVDTTVTCIRQGINRRPLDHFLGVTVHIWQKDDAGPGRQLASTVTGERGDVGKGISGTGDGNTHCRPNDTTTQPGHWNSSSDRTLYLQHLA